jgi:hypothetical protein
VGKEILIVKKTFSLPLSHYQVRLFYISQILLAMTVYHLSGAHFQEELYQWPLFWFKFVGSDLGLKFIFVFFWLVTVSSIFLYRKVFVRVLSFISHLFIASALNIPGIQSNHSTYGYLIVSFILIFYDFKDEKRAKETTILAMMGMMIPYFCAGVQKIIHVNIAIFDPEILNRILVQRYLYKGNSLLFPEFIDIGFWTRPLFPLIVILQLMTIFVPFYPKFYRPVAGALILFHLLSIMLLEVYFIPSIYLLIIFFIIPSFKAVQRTEVPDPALV